MNQWLNGSAEERIKSISKFYLAIFGLLVGFLVVEVLIEDFIVGKTLGFFEHMIPASILYAVMLSFTLWYARKTGLLHDELGWHSSYVSKSIVIGLLATSGYLIAVVAFQIPLAFTSFVDIFIILGFTLMIGVTEETAFRGFIQGSLMKSFSQMKAVLITGILFALLHVPSYVISGNFFNAIGLPSLVLVGLILGYIRIHTGNIWGVIIAHATWDFYLFLFTPEIGTGSEIMELIVIMAASGAMWGSILLSMFLAKWWIDRPSQIPEELTLAYQLKIEGLLNQIWKLNNVITSLQIQGYHPSYRIVRYREKIKLYEHQLAILKKYLPLLNEKNYKIIHKLVPCQLKLSKIELQFSKGGSPLRLAGLEAKRTFLWNEAQFLENQLGTPKYNWD